MVQLIKPKTVSKIQKVSVIDGTSAYAQLKHIVTKEGILKRAYGYYFLLTAFSFGGFFLSLYYIFITPLSWQLAGWVFLLSFFTVQIGGLIHDAGHRAIFATPRSNDIFGYVCDFLVMIGYGAWNNTHNKHHSHPNTEDEDPDLDLPFHSFTKEQLARQKGILRFLSRYQAYIFYPLRSLVPISRRMASIAYFREEKRWGIWWEVVIWSFGFFVWFILPFLIFPLSKAIFLFIFVNLTTGFYMSNIFAPNHKGMPQMTKEVKLSFLERQVLTSRNIYGNWLIDFVYMGLNHQIEHHLFPNCPRYKLSRITPHVKEVCKKLKIEFTEVSVLESNRIILSELNKVAADA